MASHEQHGGAPLRCRRVVLACSVELKSCTSTGSGDSVLVVALSQLDDEIKSVRSGLRKAGVPSRLISSISTRATRSGRRQAGQFRSNREPRWKLSPNDPQYGTEDDCKVIELQLLGMMCEFVNAPDIDEQTRNVLAAYIGHPPVPGTYRDALTNERLDYNDFLDATLNLGSGRPKFYVGYDDPSKQPKHTPDNVSWRSGRSNAFQGDMTLSEARTQLIEAVPSADSDPQDGLDQTDLLFRIYVPSERLYAAEADRLLSLFRDWLIATRGHGIRQSGYSTASGKMYEFFTDTSAVQAADLGEELDGFANFLALSTEDPSAAIDLLAAMGLGRRSSSDLVAWFGKEVRRLQLDLRHERERRVLNIRHDLEEQLVTNGVALREIPTAQINAMLDRLVPGPSAPASLALLATPWSVQPAASLTVNINPQITNAMQSTIIQNVQGTVHLGVQAKELLALIERFGGNETATLESALHELEDTDAPAAAKSAARRRLQKFLSRLTGPVRDVAIDLFEKYLESKLGL